MKKRGKVLRDTTLGPGLLIIEGQQYRFSLEDVWKSEALPKPGMVVDVEVDTQGVVHSINVVSGSQLTQEQAETSQVGPLVARLGMPAIAAAGVLLAAWVFLTATSITVPFPGRLEFTFWQLFGFLRTKDVQGLLDGRNNPGAGLYGLVALAALSGPFIHSVWNDRRAFLGGVLPLLFMLIVGIAVRGSVQTALGGDHAGLAGNGAMKAVSIGIGTYVSMIAGLYLALASLKSLLLTKASSEKRRESTQRKAA